MKLLSATLAAGLIALLWLLFAPAEIGGRTHYVVVTGESMEPGLHSGDLAIVRSAPEYRVGDVVTYRHPELGVVIHRIVGIEGARYTVQGDNNDWVDSHAPVASEIAGKLWFDIPGAGRYLNIMRQPFALALLALVVGLSVMLPGRTHKRTRTPASGTGLPSLAEPRGRDLLSLLAVLSAGALLLAGLAFTRSPERQTVREITYEQHGTFSYSAPASEEVYDADTVTSGEPIFRELIDRFDVQFEYALESGAPVEAGGTASLRAELRADNGWKRGFELQPAADFDGRTATLRGTVDLDELQRIIDHVEAETGVAVRQYKLAIQPNVNLEGSVAGQAVSEKFTPEITFLLDSQQLQLIESPSPEEGVLEQGAGGLITQTANEPNTIALAGLDLRVNTARQLSIATLGLIVLATGILVANTLRSGSRSETERLASRYVQRVVNVRAGALAADDSTIEVESFDDFERLLAHHAGPIFRDGPAFFIDHDGQRYRLRTRPYFDESGDESLTRPIPLRPPSRPRQAIGQLLFHRRQRANRA